MSPKLSKVEQPTTDLYKNQPNMVNELNGFYYIHYHKKNVGRMYDGADLSDGMKDAEIMEKFQEYKNNKLSNIVINQYMQGVQASIQQIGPYSNLIQNAFNTNKNGGQSEQILDKFSKVLEEGYQQSFDTSRIVSLLAKENEASWKEGKGDALQRILDGEEGPGVQEGVDFLDKQLEALAKTVALIQDEKMGKSLKQGLIALTNKGYSYQQIGAGLMAELNKSKYNDLQGSSIQVKELQAAVSMLKKIGSYLENPNNEQISAGSLKGLIQNQFFATMAEYFMLRVKKGATNSIFKNMNNWSFKQTGQDKNIKVELSSSETGGYSGTYLKNSYFNDASSYSTEEGKADGEIGNIGIDLKSIFDDGAGYGDLTMTLRISNKAYSTNHFGGNGTLEKYNDVFGLGGGMLIGQGLDLLFGISNINNKYLAYNVLCRKLNKGGKVHGNGFPKALKALQDVLLTRNIVYLAAGRGKKDFAQLLLLNGQVMSTWDIVKYVINNDVGISSSMISSVSDDDSGNNNGVYLSLGKRENIYKALEDRNPISRTKNVNQKIANKAMHLHIIPKKILGYVQTMSANKPINI